MMNVQQTFERVTNEPVQITVNGNPRKLTGHEAFFWSLQTRACKGEPSAMKIYADFLKFLSGGREQGATGHEDFLASLGSGPPPDPDRDPS